MLSPTSLLHLEWIKKHPLFVPYGSVHEKTYFEDMMVVYKSLALFQPNSVEFLADDFFKVDLKQFESYEERLATKKIQYDIAVKHIDYFCTIGFNHQTWSVDKCVTVINTILSFPWVEKCRAVFEYHRENGEHPHCHLLITCQIQKSKVVEKLWATKGIKKVCLKKTFIDVKPAIPAHYKYILLDKQESKLNYVKLDRSWRLFNQIPEYFEK